MTNLTLVYQRDYRRRNPRDPIKRRIEGHLLYYRSRPHPRPCLTCSHPCPGAGCLTTLHNPYQVLCSFCAKP